MRPALCGTPSGRGYCACRRGPTDGGRDRRRDQRLEPAGYDPLSFTRRQILKEPDGVLATVAALLARAGASAPR
jgi:very-short-patch-repair endonuclease